MATIAQLLPRLEAGGVERGTVEVAEALVAAGYCAVVISAGGSMVAELERIGAIHIACDLADKNPLSVPVRAKRLANILTEYQVDLVDTRSRVPAWLYRFARTKMAKPPLWVSSYHGVHKANNSIKKYYNSVMVGGDRVVAVSEAVQQHLIQSYPLLNRQKLAVIPRGCDLSRFKAKDISEQAHATWCARWELDPKIPIVLLIGRLTRLKGADLLWDALKHCQKPWQLLLIGEGTDDNPFLAHIRHEAAAMGLQECIRWLGHQSCVQDFYPHVAVLVCASRQPEAFGRTVIEAAACGIPAIVPEQGGTAEIVIDGEGGWHYALGNVNDLAAKLDHVLALPCAERKRFGKQARVRVQNNFTLVEMQRKTLGLYQDMLRQNT